jgi:hypothetical protein
MDACAAVLAAAFQDDPGTIVFLPDDTERAAILPDFFRTFVAAALSEDAGIVVTGDPIAGVACWFGPERHGPSPEAMGANDFGAILERSGPDATGRRRSSDSSCTSASTSSTRSLPGRRWRPSPASTISSPSCSWPARRWR